MGIPQKLVVLIFKTIQDMNHIICMVFRDSESYINGKELGKPYQVILQDNRVGPIIQAATSVPAVEVLHEKDYGVKITSAILKQSSKLISSIFIDDIDLAIGKLNRGESDNDRVNQDLQTVIEYQEGCLKFNDRVIRLDKSFVYIINF